ncbi:MAG: TIM barrel protein, partial [Candidatus Paceibacterota bacterium]
MLKAKPSIGAHLSTSGGLAKTFSVAKEIEANAIQIFSKNPMAAKLKTFSDDEINDAKNSPDRTFVKYLVIHASYLLNFAKKLDKNAFQIKSLVEDIKNSEAIGGDGVVLHLGKGLDLDRKEAIKIFVENIK